MTRTAQRLGTSARTLYRWSAAWRADRLEPRPLGRPSPVPPVAVRQAVIAVLVLVAPELGVSALQQLFPSVPRAALVELKQRYLRYARRTIDALVHHLRWHRVGAVWAMDFADPPHAIEGVYRKLLLVRDLASGEVLVSLPCPGATATLTVGIVESLVRWLGAPLVIKVDNGSAFISEEFRQWAVRHGVRILYSPAWTPSYNGSIEAGVGSIKTRAWHHAARYGRPAEWNCEDIEAARLEANATGRPNGRRGPTPDEAWAGREPITQADRETFAAACRRLETAERSERGIADDVHLQRAEQANIDRVVLARALIEQGYLSIRRRRITPPKNARPSDSIT